MLILVLRSSALHHLVMPWRRLFACWKMTITELSVSSAVSIIWSAGSKEAVPPRVSEIWNIGVRSVESTSHPVDTSSAGWVYRNKKYEELEMSAHLVSNKLTRYSDRNWSVLLIFSASVFTVLKQGATYFGNYFSVGGKHETWLSTQTEEWIKSKTIPLEAWTGPERSRRLEF